ncbi:MAG: hypothetical protein JWP95_2122 [Actinotalea sp.]|nr:hypothetical protein [Actinotalea sp.]
MGLDIADGDEGPLSQPGATEPAPTTPPATTATGSVPEPCLQAAEYNDTLTQAIDDIALGVRDQDARALQETLDTIQEAQPEGEAASDECRALAGATEPAEEDADGEAEETTEPSTEVSPEPTEGEPSPTPTP